MPKKKLKKRSPKKVMEKVLKEENVYEVLDLPKKEEDYLLKGLTPKRIRFCEEIVKGKRPTEAYVLAGYKARNKNLIFYWSNKLLEDEKIKQYISWLVKQKRERNFATVNRVIKELSTIAFASLKDFGEWHNGIFRLYDSNDLDEELIGAIAEIQVTYNQYGANTKIKLWSKLQALELLGKYLKIWADKGSESEDEIRSKAERIKNFVTDLLKSVPPPQQFEEKISLQGKKG